MKIYLLWYGFYRRFCDDTELIGAFSSLEKAETVQKEIIKNAEESLSLKHGKGFYTSIQQVEVDAK